MQVFKDLLNSKKFQAALMGILSTLIAYLTQTISAHELWMGILGALGAFITAQGIADHGKEAAKIQNYPISEHELKKNHAKKGDSEK